MNSVQITRIKESADAIKDCAFHLQDALNELQRIMDLLNEIVVEEQEEKYV